MEEGFDVHIVRAKDYLEDCTFRLFVDEGGVPFVFHYLFHLHRADGFRDLGGDFPFVMLQPKRTIFQII